MAARNSAANDGGANLSLRTWALEAEAAAGIARSLAPTAFIPDHLRVWTNPAERDPAKRVLDFEGTVAQVTAVLLAGQELEFGPMASLRAFVIIRGTVALYAVAARALLLRHGHEIVVHESTASRAIVRVRRAGSDDWQQVVWDTERARLAGLYPGRVDGQWRTQTKSMLVARATAEGCRWVAADALLGLPLLAEEVADEMRGTAEAPDPDAPPPGSAATSTSTTTRARPPRSAAVRAGLPVAAPLGTQAPPPAPADSTPPPGTPPPSKQALGKIHAGLRDMGVTGAAEGLALISIWAGRPITSTGHLMPDEVKAVLIHLREIAAARAADRGEDQPPPPEGGQPMRPPPAGQPGQDAGTAEPAGEVSGDGDAPPAE
ncbi:MAG TPA: hypothetical protein VH136_18545 [Trebonia sp.]|jgi:hypothetical protein|nr:hypothetical protein [Trebonia sp.]